MANRQRLHFGDVFLVPLSEDRVTLGQVVGTYQSNAYYMAIFDWASDHEPDADELVVISRKHLVLLALSLDGKVFAGQWKIIGNVSVSPEIFLPVYKVAVETLDNIWIQDYSGRLIRKAAGNEAAQLTTRRIVSPARVEAAAKAAFGFDEWNPAYDVLRPPPSGSLDLL